MVVPNSFSIASFTLVSKSSFVLHSILVILTAFVQIFDMSSFVGADLVCLLTLDLEIEIYKTIFLLFD